MLSLFKHNEKKYSSYSSYINFCLGQQVLGIVSFFHMRKNYTFPASDFPSNLKNLTKKGWLNSRFSDEFLHCEIDMDVVAILPSDSLHI